MAMNILQQNVSFSLKIPHLFISLWMHVLLLKNVKKLFFFVCNLGLFENIYLYRADLFQVIFNCTLKKMNLCIRPIEKY